MKRRATGAAVEHSASTWRAGASLLGACPGTPHSWRRGELRARERNQAGSCRVVPQRYLSAPQLAPWTQDRLLTVQARRLAERFGSNDEADAVLRVWRSPAHLRQRVHDLVRADEALLERAVRSKLAFCACWPVKLLVCERRRRLCGCGWSWRAGSRLLVRLAWTTAYVARCG